MDENTKEVYYNEYCHTCKYENNEEGSDECNDCLNTPYNFNSHKPVNWEGK